MRVATYLVLGQHNVTGKTSVRRAVSRYPALDSNEAVIELELDVPDDLFDAPLFTVKVEKRHIAVAVEAQEAEEVPA